MDYLISRQEDFKLSWQPGCSFDGKSYQCGPVGRKGPGCNCTQMIQPPVIPDAISFQIGFTDKSGNLYQEILDELYSSVAPDNFIEIHSHGPTRVKHKKNFKPKYENMGNEIVRKNIEIHNRASDLIQELFLMGCEIERMSGPKLDKIPDEYYDIEEYLDYTHTWIHVHCHSGTKLYRFLNKHGILEKYFPEWYKLGKF